MMKMDGRDSVKCQNWEKNDMIGIKGKDLNDNKTKEQIVSSLLNQKKKTKIGRRDAVAKHGVILERERLTSL